MRFRNAFICLYVLMMLLAVGCGVISQIEVKKAVIDKDKFVDASETAGFSVMDVSDQYTEVRGLVSALYATNGDGSLVCQFFVFEDQDIADSEFDIFKKTLDNTYVRELDASFVGDNFLVYKMTGKKDYHHLCAVDNTLFYGKSSNEEMEIIRDFAKGFGYN